MSEINDIASEHQSTTGHKNVFIDEKNTLKKIKIETIH